MEARIQEDCHAKKLKGITIHMDNVEPPNSKRAESEIERLELRRMQNVSSAISPRYIAMRVLVLELGEEHFEGAQTHERRRSVEFALGDCNRNRKEPIFDVYGKWISRFHELFRIESEYGSEWHKQFLISF
jgi:hypothetical protein